MGLFKLFKWPMGFIQLGSGYGFLNKNPVRILNITTNQTHHNIFTYIIKFFLLSSSYPALNFIPLKQIWPFLFLLLALIFSLTFCFFLLFFFFYNCSSTILVIVASLLCIHLSTFVLCCSTHLWPLLLFVGCIFYFEFSSL
jgi:hypothetical protein